MAEEDIITATQKELRALHVIRKAIEKIRTQKEAGESIGLSERQIRRKVKRVRGEGDEGFTQFRDTVIEYLEDEDKKSYSSPEIWDEIKLKAAGFLEEIRNEKE